MFKFEELRVYKEAIEISKFVYKITQKWPNSETYALTDQLRRAVVSIVLNIAEGSSRTSKDFGHFLSIARGSCYECIAILTIARDLRYIDQINYQDLYVKIEIISKMLTSLKLSIS